MTNRNYITGQIEQPDPFSAMFAELKQAVGMDEAIEAVHGYRKADDYPKMTLAEARAKRLAPKPPKPVRRVVRFVVRTRIGMRWVKNAKGNPRINRIGERKWIAQARARLGNPSPSAMGF